MPRNSVVRLPDRNDMTIVVDWDVEPQIKQEKNQIYILAKKANATMSVVGNILALAHACDK